MMNVCSGSKNAEMSHNGFDSVEDLVGASIRARFRWAYVEDEGGSSNILTPEMSR